MYKPFLSLVSLSMLMISCSNSTPTEIPLPVQVVTLPPTQTAAPAYTSTPEQPTPTPDVIAAMLPSGIPDKEWNGIPIMPGAINGEGDSQGYTFTIQIDSESIQQFYKTELANLGFDLFATGDGSQKQTVMLMFMKDTSLVSISIFPHDDLMLVLIVK